MPPTVIDEWPHDCVGREAVLIAGPAKTHGEGRWRADQQATGPGER